MLTALLVLVLFVAPLGLYYFREYRRSTPRLQWPVLAKILNLEYSDAPPRIRGQWNGRPVEVAEQGGGVVAFSELSRPSRLRLEIGPRAEVARRAGMIVPDPVATGDAAFEERFLARCSDKQAGSAILDPVLRQRLLALPDVEILAEGARASWRLPALKDPDTLEAVCDIICVIAVEMERFPAHA